MDENERVDGCTLFIYPSIHPSIHLSIYPSIYLSIYQDVEEDLQSAYERMKEAQEAVDTRLPR